MASLFFLDVISRNWWVWLIRGLLAVLFGIMAFALPELTLVALVLLFGVYALSDGLTSLFVGLSFRMWALALFGILGILAGVYTFIQPNITAVALIWLIAAWSIVRGVFEVVAAIELRKVIEDEWLLILGGILSIVFGIAVYVYPGAGALAMVWLVGMYALIFGGMMIALAFRVRGLRKRFGA